MEVNGTRILHTTRQPCSPTLPTTEAPQEKKMKKEKKLKQEADFDFSKDMEEEEVRRFSFCYLSCIWYGPSSHHKHTYTGPWKEWKEEKSKTHPT